MALIADISVPELPTGRATIVATHLENKCPPECRRRQIQALLANVKSDTNPVVVAGDLNTTSRDNTPTSIRNEIMTRVTDYKFWIGQAVSHFNPLGIFQYMLYPVRYVHGYNDPTAFHLPILWDNREQPLFRTAEKFRFDRQSCIRFSRRAGTDASAQESDARGQQPARRERLRSYLRFHSRLRRTRRPVQAGLDLRQAIHRDPRRVEQSYRFAPHFPVTMRELNESVTDRISDHPPMTVDLPLTEPKKFVR